MDPVRRETGDVVNETFQGDLPVLTRVLDRVGDVLVDQFDTLESVIVAQLTDHTHGPPEEDHPV